MDWYIQDVNGNIVNPPGTNWLDVADLNFDNQAINAMETEHDKDLILLAEGARNDHFTAGFQMNYSWTFYTKLKQVFNQNVSAHDLVSIHLSEYNSLPLENTSWFDAYSNSAFTLPEVIDLDPYKYFVLRN